MNCTILFNYNASIKKKSYLCFFFTALTIVSRGDLTPDVWDFFHHQVGSHFCSRQQLDISNPIHFVMTYLEIASDSPGWGLSPLDCPSTPTLGSSCKPQVVCFGFGVDWACSVICMCSTTVLYPQSLTGCFICASHQHAINWGSHNPLLGSS